MLFNSLEFIFLFVPVTLLLFFQMGGRGYQKGAIGTLVAASLFFYGYWNPSYLALLIFSILFNYGVGSLLSAERTAFRRKKLLLTLGIGVNIALIGYLKYANFFIDTVNSLLDTSFNLNKIILPLAISFFTFQQIAYLVDAYRGETKEYSFLNYCLFVTFFPQLIAGPIVHHKEVMSQFADKSTYRFNPENLAVGLTMFLLGLYKKVLIADRIAAYVTPVFNAALAGRELTFYDAWSGAFFYAFQLYFDFSGYSDMAIGAARMFGIKLPINFNSPYKATNIIDFWRRWHMTLSRFLRDYLYIPLGGNRLGEMRRYINLMITMLLGGLWHGAGWTFVFWGGLHGVYLVINNQWRSLRKNLGQDLQKSQWWSRGIGCILTFLAVVVAWVFFRAENMQAAMVMLQSMFGAHGFSLSASLVEQKKKLLVLVILCLFVWLAPNTQEWMMRYNPALNLPVVEKSGFHQMRSKLQWKPGKWVGIILGILAFIVVKEILEAPYSDFLYFDF